MGLKTHGATEYIPLQDLQKALPPKPTPGETITSWRRRHSLVGWRYGVWVAATTTTCILVVNVVLTIQAVVKYGTVSGIGVAYEGECAVVNSYTTWLHILINIIGSLLLTASNYCMQCLSAPTRTECDNAHAKGDWLDIGVLSVRNVFKLNRGRIVLWFILAFSSVPIHLLYNSTIFKTVTANYYHALVVDEGFVQGLPLTMKHYTTLDSRASTFHPTAYFDFQESWLVNGSTYKNLTAEECVRSYAIDYVQDYNNVLLVKHSDNTTIGTVFSDVLGPEAQILETSARSLYKPYEWLCSGGTIDDCTQQNLLKNASTYSWYEHKIAYCLAEQPPPHCQLQFSMTLLITVIVCNALKAAVMVTILWFHSTPTLVVVGDAIASYLEQPDAGGVEPLSRSDVTSKAPTWLPDEEPQRWMSAASGAQWTFFVVLCIVTLTTTGWLLFLATSSATSTGGHSSAFSIGFGVMTPSTIISSLFESQDNVQATTSAILLGNLPQVVMSSAYLLFNALFTAMLLSYEWSGYALAHQPLRVTFPMGKQRSTYWLSLPLLYSVPLLAISAFMHWLISEALFLIRLQTRDVGYTSSVWINSTVGVFPYYASGRGFLKHTGAELGDPVVFYPNHTHVGSTYLDHVRTTSSALGYSPTPILCAFSVGLALFVGILAIAYLRRFKSNMPVASSCSVAIAAACHPPDGDTRCAVGRVQWGEVTSISGQSQFTFTSKEVKAVYVAKPRKRWIRRYWKRKDEESKALQPSL